MNPPYHEETRHDVSKNIIKRTANAEKDGDLLLWIMSAMHALKPSGTLTLIHRADRLQEILSHMKNAFGEIELLFLLPKADAEPKRIIVRGRKGARYEISECQPLTLHTIEGGYTEAAENVLRHCQKLAFVHLNGSLAS
jgi:tRNA1(Val) A37 N6-methylase TrmN6